MSLPDYASMGGKFRREPDLGAQLFDQLTATNEMAASYLKLGRQQMARDVLSIIGTASIHKPLPSVIQELIAKCGEEQ